MDEIWKAIPSAPDYEVSDRGRVRKLPRPLKPQSLATGHQVVSLGRNRKRLVHRLVLEAFAGPCPDGHEGCHAPNPDPRDNRLANLRWGTHAENCADTVRMGRARGGTTKGEAHHNAKLNAASVSAIRAAHADGASNVELAKRFGVTDANICAVLKRKTWRHV